MKLSVITATYNRSETILETIASVRSQTHIDVEHILIDGASTDGTIAAIEGALNDRTIFTSEPDEGIYDAISKGIRLATGDAIGLLHSDDLYANNEVLEKIALAFENPLVDAVYGDLHYVSKNDTTRVVRQWRAGTFNHSKLKRGWMPPHPTLYLRRSVIDRFGGYDTSYRIAADYDAVLRYFSQVSFRAQYIPEVLVLMRLGGVSNRSLRNMLRKSREDYRALRSNGVGGAIGLACKNFRKLPQFILH